MRDKVVDFTYILCLHLIPIMLLGVPVWFLPIIGVLDLIVLIFRENKKKCIIAGIFTLIAVIDVGLLGDFIGRAVIVWLFSIFILMRYDKIKNSDNLAKTFTIAMPFLVVFIVEYMQKNLYLMWCNLYIAHEITCHCLWFATIVLIWLIYIIVSKITRNRFIATVIVTAPLFIAGFVNMVVVYLTSRPFILSDILIFKTAMSVISGQRLSVGLVLLGVGAIVMIALFYVAAWKVYKGFELPKFCKKDALKMVASGILIGAIILAVGSLSILNFQSNIKYGYLFSLVLETTSEVEEPKGYEKTDISNEAEGRVKSKTNVVVVMSEAFGDLGETYGLETSEDIIPYFHSLQEKYPHGTAYSSVFGNNTISSEVEFLTGLSTAFCGRGSNLYQQGLKSLDEFYSLGEYYQKQGYKAAFFHPYMATNYNRLYAYEKMEYDSITFLEDLDKDTEVIRGLVSDKANFDKVYEILENTDEPVFIMNTTMQNHASYEDGLVKPEIEVSGLKGNYPDIEEYITLLNKSDDALKGFLTKLEKSNEDTIVLIFGDHQPMVNKDFYAEVMGVKYTDFTLEQKSGNYKVPYLIWSNFEMDGVKVPETTSINYLSSVLNEYMGNPSTEWYALLGELKEYYPVITENFVIDSKGNLEAIETVKKRLNNADNLSKGDQLLKEYWFECYTRAIEN